MIRSRSERSLWTAVFLGVSVLYPFAVWYGLARFEPRIVASVLAAVVLVRVVAVRGMSWRGWLVAGFALTLTALWSNSALPLKLYPVLVNAALLIAFGWSLHAPPTVIERFVRLRDPQLPPEGVAYIRRVTQVWCVFFGVNGLIALSTALWASQAAWTLYNGVIAYMLMGLLFAGEYLIRRRVMRRRHG